MIPNDAYWEMETDPAPLLEFAISHSGASGRKLRLFACACAWCLLSTDDIPDFRAALAVAEQFADGTASMAMINNAWQRMETLSRMWSVGDSPVASAICCALEPVPDIAARQTLLCLRDYSDEIEQPSSPPSLDLLREIFGNPFRPSDFAPWRTGTAVALARGMYESRDFSAMPILADALQDAGCDNAEVLNHCRSEGLHVRGCWVVDGVLGLE